MRLEQILWIHDKTLESGHQTVSTLFLYPDCFIPSNPVVAWQHVYLILSELQPKRDVTDHSLVLKESVTNYRQEEWKVLVTILPLTTFQREVSRACCCILGKGKERETRKDKANDLGWNKHLQPSATTEQQTSGLVASHSCFSVFLLGLCLTYLP